MLHKTAPASILLISSLCLAVMLTACDEGMLSATDDSEVKKTEMTDSYNTGSSQMSGNMPGSSGNRGNTYAVTNVLDQMDDEGGREVYAEDAASLRRTKNSISFKVQMPTPEPGEYIYPTEGEYIAGEGHPEAYSLWVFVFDDELGEFGDFPWSSAFLGGGHVVGGPNLTLSGQLSRSSEPFAGFDLENPQEAEIHLAVAPHGALEPELMPGQIKTPSGPGPDIWWVALFE